MSSNMHSAINIYPDDWHQAVPVCTNLFYKYNLDSKHIPATSTENRCGNLYTNV